MLVARTSSHQSRMDVENSTGYQFIKTENLFAFSVSLYYFYYYYSYVTASFLLTRVTVACTVVAVAVAIFFFFFSFELKSWVCRFVLGLDVGFDRHSMRVFGLASHLRWKFTSPMAMLLRCAAAYNFFCHLTKKKKPCWDVCWIHFFFLFQKYIKMQMSLDFESPERAVEWAKWWMFAERARL